MSVPLSVWSTLMDRKNVYESLQVIAHFGLRYILLMKKKQSGMNADRRSLGFEYQVIICVWLYQTTSTVKYVGRQVLEDGTEM